jgi:hypothetical protein
MIYLSRKEVTKYVQMYVVYFSVQPFLFILVANYVSINI